ncbi:acyl-CoA dehydrogenase family protein [Nocardia sp. NPDC058058]|uniref:acyl-CoA dehydrogenase family protein n=1 Tax=Nocardia sp. NPDC058058 TaxID=3346317 RepID=UPI0036DC01A8
MPHTESAPDTLRQCDSLITAAAEDLAAGRYRAVLGELLRAGVVESILDPAAGVGNPARECCIALERIARHSVELAEAVQVQALAANTIRRHGSDRLWSALGPGLRTGEILAVNCMSEPNAGSDLSALELTAVRDGDRYRLTGYKNWAAHAAVANELIVYARTSDAGIGGITAFLVPADTPGVRVSAPFEQLRGLAIPVSDIVFDDASVPAERILGRRDRGALVSDILVTQGRLGLAACAIGLGDAAYERALDFAGSTVRFGQVLIEHQSVGFTLADMATGLTAARQLLYHACAGFDRDPLTSTLVCAQAKLFATDTAARITADAVELLGASAYLPGEPVEHSMRQAKLLQTLQGTNRIQRLTIANRLRTDAER